MTPRRESARCRKCGNERAYSGDSNKCLGCGGPWRRKESARERDERIVAEAAYFTAAKHGEFGVWVVIPQRIPPHSGLRADRVAKALARIGTRIARERRRK
jgi:ribosomal protein L37E